MAESCRYEVRFAGRVQGVGFRATTWQIAARYSVSGYVRNLPDGRVELVAEGASAELDRFLAELRQTMGRYLRDEDLVQLPAQGGFPGFEIRR